MPQRIVRRVGSSLALQDGLTLAYLAALLLFTAVGDGPRRGTALAYLGIDSGLFALGLVLGRAGLLPSAAASVAYRLGLFGAIFGSFCHLQYVLPTARSTRLDAQIHAFDLAVFGCEPAELFDAFVSVHVTEWFSFFYFGYFVVLGAHVLPLLFSERDRSRLGELALGVVALFCIGHLTYIAVPGYGPYQHLAGRFVHELDGPLWWRCVRTAVDAGEVTARTDIFPSLHTAAPTYLALFSFRHRRVWPFKATWLPLAFFASQIVVSTMYLRWHYLADVVAGLAFASALAWAVPRVAAWEERRRTYLGVEPVLGPSLVARAVVPVRDSVRPPRREADAPVLRHHDGEGAIQRCA